MAAADIGTWCPDPFMPGIMAGTRPEKVRDQPMTREYPYRITLLLYSGKRIVKHIKAANQRDAFDKAHRFANPIAASGRDGVQFINTEKLTKAYCEQRGIVFD